jgi:hypothetical protein
MATSLGNGSLMRRVLSRLGGTMIRIRIECYLTACRGPGGAARQAAALRQEGVIVNTGNMGVLSVDLGAYGWFPASLPSEEEESEQE